ncbi:hypothetical protein WJ74_22615 [Burkholderia ubonensis]|nr:hypothetical protein WJ74_22615 [Burkholderia ubonensis]
MRYADEGSGFFLVEVESQRVSVPRSPFEHEKPAMHLETAMVVGPPGAEVYTDELNRIRVQFEVPSVFRLPEAPGYAAASLVR